MHEFSDLPLFGNGSYEWKYDEKKHAQGGGRVFDVLKDGNPHTTSELLQRTGNHRFACGIYWLRRNGYIITTNHAPGSEDAEYRMTGYCKAWKPTKDHHGASYWGGRHWKAFRLMRLEHDGYKCINCHVTDDLVVHHWKYDLYNERLGDTHTYCDKCHQRMHQNIPTLVFPKYLPEEIIERIEAGE